MKEAEKQSIVRAIDQLEKRLPPSAVEAEILAGRILEAVMGDEGYTVKHVGYSGDAGFDFVASRPADVQYTKHTIGIEFKYHRKPLQVVQVRELIGAALLSNFDRAMLLASAGFTKGARQIINRELPVTVELLDIPTLRDWVHRLVTDELAPMQEVRDAVRFLSKTLALLVARDPKKLDDIEWRDLERLLAEAFDGIGFRVALTPPSKDGGKDIILGCTVTGKTRTYVVEVKHWRAGGKVGSGTVSNFLKVIARESRHGGMLLSSSGYTQTAFEQLSEIDRQALRFGGQAKIVSICRTYLKAASGIWSPPESLAELLYEETV